jgi:hypothetical protein
MVVVCGGDALALLGRWARGGEWRIDFDFKSERFSYLSDPRGALWYNIANIHARYDQILAILKSLCERKARSDAV